jgi:hypothetical protein
MLLSSIMLSKSFVRWTLPISMLYVAVLGRELVPIHPSSGHGNQKRDHTELDLKSQQTFLWGESGRASLNLSIENINS